MFVKGSSSISPSPSISPSDFINFLMIIVRPLYYQAKNWTWNSKRGFERRSSVHCSCSPLYRHLARLRLALAAYQNEFLRSILGLKINRFRSFTTRLVVVVDFEKTLKECFLKKHSILRTLSGPASVCEWIIWERSVGLMISNLILMTGTGNKD